MVDAESFRDLVLKGTTGKTIMGRKKLTKLISEKFQLMTENLKAEFEAVDYICICADIWTGANRDNS